jgi:hypothetical protein
MAFALQCLGPKFPDPVARDFNPTTPLNAYRGEAPSPVRLGSVSDRRDDTTVWCRRAAERGSRIDAAR